MANRALIQLASAIAVPIQMMGIEDDPSGKPRRLRLDDPGPGVRAERLWDDATRIR